MKIKNKIRLGLIFLLAIIITLAGTGSYYVNNLADISSATLKNNYETLDYTKQMIKAIDEKDAALAEAKFDESLRKQEGNITEKGEREATTTTRQLFEQYRQGNHSEAIKSELRKNILEIQELNMQAIVRKSNQASTASKNMFAYITILGTCCFLLSFTFVINFPGMIANPITTLTTGIRAIANKNYKERINFSSHDEFGELADAFNSMAQKLDEYESSNLNKIMFEKKRIETIINTMRDAIIGFDDHNKILFANGVAIQLLGVSEKEIVGQYAPDVALHNDLLRTLLQKLPGDKPIKIFADGKESYFTHEVLQITGNKQKIGEVIVLRNVTRYQELDQAKTNLIATISHELKTPISSIKMSLQLLDDNRVGTINSEQQKLVNDIKDDANRLLKITGELLNMAQVETGNIQLSLQTMQPAQVIERAMDACKNLAEQKQLKLETIVDAPLKNVQGDLDKSVWVMVNLLTNAIRYSPNGATIQLSATASGNAVVFSVKDNGRGIEEKYLARIFERYYQVPGTIGGTGLGLSISKEFIDAQGGQMGVESKYAEGSRFWFSLPVAR